MSESIERHTTTVATGEDGMRAYLRPQHAPQSLIDRLEATLDHCCGE